MSAEAVLWVASGYDLVGESIWILGAQAPQLGCELTPCALEATFCPLWPEPRALPAGCAGPFDCLESHFLLRPAECPQMSVLRETRRLQQASRRAAKL